MNSLTYVKKSKFFIKRIEEWQKYGELYGIKFRVDDLERGKYVIRGLLREYGYRGERDVDFVVFGYQNGYSAGIAFKSDLNWPMIGLGIREKINLQDTDNSSK